MNMRNFLLHLSTAQELQDSYCIVMAEVCWPAGVGGGTELEFWPYVEEDRNCNRSQ
jgi:hypothetical protein